MISRKAFAVEYIGGKTRLRVLVTNPTATKYNPDIHFLSHEESDYLGLVLGGVPYATFKTDERKEMEDLLYNGYVDNTGIVWVAFFAYWKDQEGHAFMVPETSGIRDLRDVGVSTYMKSPADFMKVGKYANRLFAALPKNYAIVGEKYGVWGKEIDWMEGENMSSVLIDQEPGEELSESERELSVRFVDLDTLNPQQKALVDGCMVVSEKACRLLGLSDDPRLGMAWRGTFGTPRGLGKGHILYKNDMLIDVVIYGPKTILRTERFFFGSMGRLHVGKPHTDRQAFVNFQYHRPGLAVDLAKQYLLRVFAQSRNEHDLRKVFLDYTQDFTHEELSQEGWILRRALTYGVSPLRFPGLFRRVVRYLAGPNSPVFQCDTMARIPMGDIASYGYVLPDPNAIDSEGDVHSEKAIPEGTIAFPDVKPGTSVTCYRQPSEHSNAWVPLKVVYRPEFQPFAGRGICLLGQGADKVLGRLGGGDMDDQFVIIHDPKWVQAFHTMRMYPETAKLSAEITPEEQDEYNQQQTELNEFTEELLQDIRDRNLSHYTNKHVSWQIDMAKNARAGIGPVVNYGIIDMLLSDPDHRVSMFEDLVDPQAIEWLKAYKPYQASFLMSNLELVIDANVKDNTLMRKLGDVSGTIKEFHNSCLVYPTSQESRIPLSRAEKGDYFLARSLMCRALETIRGYRERMMEVFVEREWDTVAPADRELRDAGYRFDRDVNIRVRGEWRRTEDGWERVDPDTLSLQDIWVQGWIERLQLPDDDPRKANAYEEVVDLIRREVEGEDDDVMERIAVEIYFLTYSRRETTPKVDEVTGKLRGYSDGLLWCPVFANHFINVLRKTQLAGYYAGADLRPEYRRRLINKSVVVEVRDRRLYVQDSEDKFSVWIGWPAGRYSPDGRYRMDDGVIEFRRPSELCLPDNPEMVAQKPLTRVFPPAKQSVEEPERKSQPSSAFGRLLNKALDVLNLR